MKLNYPKNILVRFGNIEESLVSSLNIVWPMCDTKPMENFSVKLICNNHFDVFNIVEIEPNSHWLCQILDEKPGK